MNKLAVVTGASRGIGKAIANKFASNGFNLAICGRNPENLVKVKELIENTYGVKVYTFVADFEDKFQVKAFGQFVVNQGLRPNVLVNNAGVFMPGSILNEPDTHLETMINTNVFSAYYLTKLLVPAMNQVEKPHIFNISSIAGILPYPQSGSYTISKFALTGFSKSLRQELMSTNIKVTTVLPGATLTDSWAGVDLPQERFMQDIDIADTIWNAYNLSGSAVIEEIIMRPQKGDI